MNLRTNILVNYVSQIYVTIVSIVILPFYIKYMGIEAYGLIGFFTMLQYLFTFFDMGLSPTLARETARFRGGGMDALNYRRILRALEIIFSSIAILGAGAIYAGSEYISHDWLKVTHLSVIEVRNAVQLMAIIVSLRWMCGLYRGVISGSEQLVWLGGYNSLIATLRFAGVLLVLRYIGTTPTVFFTYQLGIAILEFAVLLYQTWKLLPGIPRTERLSCSWPSLKPVLQFSMTIAFPSMMWVLVTQSDKLVLSRILPLSEYGYYTLAVLIASGVTMMSAPISTAIMPRMSKMEAEGNDAGLIRVYRHTTQLAAVITGAASVTVAFFPKSLLWIWTGDILVADKAAPIAILYALGNGILAVSAFPFYLQYAKGNLKLHMIGSITSMALFIPVMIWCSIHYGAIGAGYTWLTINLISFVAWLPFVHRKFAPGLNLKWYSQDVLIIFFAVAVTGYLLRAIVPLNDNRWWQCGEIIIMNGLITLSGMVVSSAAWEILFLPMKRLIQSRILVKFKKAQEHDGT